MLEITEGLLIGDVSDVVAKMTALRAVGVHFSMDDFGTGYSSLAYLKRLPIHELKIDKSFINDATTNANDAALVETILTVAGHMKLQVVAEGVETQAQVDFLNSRGDVIHQDTSSPGRCRSKPGCSGKRIASSRACRGIHRLQRN